MLQKPYLQQAFKSLYMFLTPTHSQISMLTFSQTLGIPYYLQPIPFTTHKIFRLAQNSTKVSLHTFVLSPHLTDISSAKYLGQNSQPVPETTQKSFFSMSNIFGKKEKLDHFFCPPPQCSNQTFMFQ